MSATDRTQSRSRDGGHASCFHVGTPARTGALVPHSRGLLAWRATP